MLINYCKKYYTSTDGQSGAISITEDNYEYYFLLYVDNELSNAERVLVAAFVQQYPQYQQALHDIEQTRLPKFSTNIATAQLYKKTNITADNYETYVLLQIDDALTIEEAALLHSFLAKNPALATKAALLQQTKLSTATPFNFNKTLLLKPDNTIFTHTTTVAEALSLYLDGETNAGQTASIQQLINTNEAVAAEYAMLQQTKLPATTVAYPHKKILYKKTSKVRPLIPMWMRIAAAACIVGIVLFIVNSTTSKKVDGTPTVAVQPTQQSTPLYKQNAIDKVTSNNTIIYNYDVATQATHNKTSELQNTVTVPLANQNPKRTIEYTAVKKQLNKNTAVTNTTVNRITNNNNVEVPQTVLNNNENSVSTITPQVTTIPTNNTGTALSTPTTKIPVINQAVSSTLLNTTPENDVSIMSIDADKLDKNGKVKKAKNRVQRFLQEKIGSIANTSISVGKYEIALAQPR